MELMGLLTIAIVAVALVMWKKYLDKAVDLAGKTLETGLESVDQVLNVGARKSAVWAESGLATDIEAMGVHKEATAKALKSAKTDNVTNLFKVSK